MLKEEFLNRLKQRHPENFSKYDYSLLPDEFKSKDKIPIQCLIHGVFYQRPDAQLSNIGCRKCGFEKTFKSTRYNNDIYLVLCRKIHGLKYRYYNDYISARTKIKINCPLHGDFYQRALDHINQKQGCPKCANEQHSLRLRDSREDFIRKANEVHDNYYTYPRTDYKDNRTKVIITCPIHGDFLQKPSIHLRGNNSLGCGCQKCKQSNGEKYLSQILDKLNIYYSREYILKPNPYRYDFYLPEYDVYIEYHGEQHYKSVDYFGGKKALKYNKRRDKIKIEIIKRSTGLLITLKYTFNTLEKIEDELLRLFSIIHPQFIQNKELTKQSIIDSNIYLIEDGISYIRK